MLAARLASRGYTVSPEAVDGHQGLSHAAGSGEFDHRRIEEWRDAWATTQALFKHHAACHCTHAGIEATRSILANGVNGDEIERITLTVNPSILGMCGIPDPVTGLEAKFSLRGTQALLLLGADTAAVSSLGDGPINRRDVQTLLRRVVVKTDDTLDELATWVEVRTATGAHRAVGNVSRPATDLCAQCEQLRAKYDTLAAPILGEAAAAALAESLSGLVAVADIGDMMAGSR